VSELRTIERRLHIDNTPDAVMGYVSDVRNRPMYIPHLSEVSEIEGEPTAAGTRWKWTFSALGLDFEGQAHCTESLPGRRYVSVTEGGIQSTWTYDAEPAGEGTDLTVRLEYEVPTIAIPVLPVGSAVEALRNAEADRLVQNLKEILDR
jgi:carbon monoxide dehydrogenase subunit G